MDKAAFLPDLNDHVLAGFDRNETSTDESCVIKKNPKGSFTGL
jgi:hypothetical protein